ncbi:MAG: hypothetical protein U0166_25925 [Acidobacteriota bacterium]
MAMKVGVIGLGYAGFPRALPAVAMASRSWPRDDALKVDLFVLESDAGD